MPSQYGQLALGLTVAGLVNQVVMGGINNGIIRFYSIATEKKNLTGYLKASWRLMLYATIAVIVIGLLLIGGLLWLGYSQWMGLAAAALLFSLLSGYNSSLSGIQNAARQRAVVAFHGGLDAWLKVILALGLMLWLGSSSTVVIIGYVLSSFLVNVSQFIFLRSLISQGSDQTSEKYQWVLHIWTYSWPFSAWGIFTWAQLASDRWALETFATMQEVGIYAVLFQLGYTPISLASGLIISFISPILYQRSVDATDSARNVTAHRLVWRITWFSLFITGFGFGIVFVMHEWIFSILVASQYQSASYLLPWMVLAGGLFAAGQMLSLKIMIDMKPGMMTIAKIVTSILGVLLNFYFASIAGLKGIIIALVAFSGIYLAWMYYLSSRSVVHIESLADTQ